METIRHIVRMFDGEELLHQWGRQQRHPQVVGQLQRIGASQRSKTVSSNPADSSFFTMAFFTLSSPICPTLIAIVHLMDRALTIFCEVMSSESAFHVSYWGFGHPTPRIASTASCH